MRESEDVCVPEGGGVCQVVCVSGSVCVGVKRAPGGMCRGVAPPGLNPPFPAWTPHHTNCSVIYLCLILLPPNERDHPQLLVTHYAMLPSNIP